MMTREEAYYQKILLQSGIADGYDEWLDGYLISDEPIDHVVLNLLDHRDDLSGIISCLHCYCLEKPFDTARVGERLRLYLKEAYYNSKITKDECLSYLYLFSVHHREFHSELASCEWSDMERLSDYYVLVEDGILTMTQFDSIFIPYLCDGMPVDSKKYDFVLGRNI